jgi:cytochrome c biogenesis protein CcmG, thiol:disulfide interchange protein DsbE
MKTSSSRKAIYTLLAIALLAWPLSRMVLRMRVREEANLADAHEAVALLQQKVAKMPPAEAAAVIDATLMEGSDGMRYAAADISERVNDAHTIGLLKKACEDPSSEVRKRAINVLVRLDRDQGYEMLLRALLDEDSWVRDDASFQLASLTGTKHPSRDVRAVPVLMHALTDDNDRITPILMTILRHLTGNPWRCSALDPEAKRAAARAKWQAWWAASASKYPAAVPETLTPLKPGAYLLRPAPAFHVKDTEGNTVDPNEAPFKGKLLLINFWGTWCPPCKAEAPALAQVHRNYDKAGVSVIGIAGKESSREAFDNWVKLHGLAYTQVINSQADVPETVFGSVYEVPVTFLIDRHGRIRRRWDGERDFKTFDAAIRAVLSEQ